MKSGLSLREAAERAGLEHTTLYRYEEGKILRVPESTVRRLLSVYNVDPLEEYEEIHRRRMAGRLLPYAESRQEITADFLFEHFLAADERGRQTVLDILLMESRYGGSPTLLPEEERP